MLIHRLKIAGLLSFGPDGVDLAMEPLNVLIGPNGSGKSNFLETIALLRAAPSGITDPISRMGGVESWLWNGRDALDSFTLEVFVEYGADRIARHSLTLGHSNDRPEVIDEQVEPLGAYVELLPPLSYYRPEHSLVHLASPEYPILWHLKEQYGHTSPLPRLVSRSLGSVPQKPEHSRPRRFPG